MRQTPDFYGISPHYPQSKTFSSISAEARKRPFSYFAFRDQMEKKVLSKVLHSVRNSLKKSLMPKSSKFHQQIFFAKFQIARNVLKWDF